MDVISVAEKSCLDVWAVTAKNSKMFPEATSHQVIVPRDQVDLFRSATPNHIEVRNEDELASEIRTRLHELIPPSARHRAGWYLQQFIKLSALEEASRLGRNALIWDADTVPLRELQFFRDRRVPFFAGDEYHLPYFEAIERALNLDKIQRNSFIAQCFPCKSFWFRDFKAQLEQKHELPWWEALLLSIDLSLKSGFSEYETLGTSIAHNYPDEWEWSDKQWSRRGYGLFERPEAIHSRNEPSGELCFVAFERSEKANIERRNRQQTDVASGPKRQSSRNRFSRPLQQLAFSRHLSRLSRLPHLQIVAVAPDSYAQKLMNRRGRRLWQKTSSLKLSPLNAHSSSQNKKTPTELFRETALAFQRTPAWRLVSQQMR